MRTPAASSGRTAGHGSPRVAAAASVAVLLLALLPCAHGDAPAGSAPLPTRNYHPFLLPLLGLPPESAALVERGAWHAGITVAETNSILNSIATPRAELFGDVETTRITIEVRRRVSKSVELFAELPYLARGGGVMDEGIVFVERVVNALNPARVEAPTNDVRLLYTRSGSVILDESGHASGPGDLALGAKLRVGRSADGRRALALRAAVELPTGEERELFGNDRVDLGLALDGSVRTGRLDWHGTLAVVAAGDLDRALLRVRPYVTASIAAALPLGRARVVGQLAWYSSPFENGDVAELDRGLVELSLGVRLPLGERTSLTIGGVENLAVRPAADFTLLARLGRRF